MKSPVNRCVAQLKADASPVDIAVILSRDIDREEKPIAYASLVLTDTENATVNWKKKHSQ